MYLCRVIEFSPIYEAVAWNVVQYIVGTPIDGYTPIHQAVKDLFSDVVGEVAAVFITVGKPGSPQHRRFVAEFASKTWERWDTEQPGLNPGRNAAELATQGKCRCGFFPAQTIEVEFVRRLFFVPADRIDSLLIEVRGQNLFKSLVGVNQATKNVALL